MLMRLGLASSGTTRSRHLTELMPARINVVIVWGVAGPRNVTGEQQRLILSVCRQRRRFLKLTAGQSLLKHVGSTSVWSSPFT
ncbi:hypothetical protein [Pseudomonas sp. MAG733B]|uniref:hypothetical protein n=1 Tax=Pseudomonas sp. MAG733B TaxID=3122079 RepID=UPI0030CBA2A0